MNLSGLLLVYSGICVADPSPVSAPTGIQHLYRLVLVSLWGWGRGSWSTNSWVWGKLCFHSLNPSLSWFTLQRLTPQWLVLQWCVCPDLGDDQLGTVSFHSTLPPFTSVLSYGLLSHSVSLWELPLGVLLFLFPLCWLQIH